MPEMEEWKICEGFPQYEVSTLGKIRRATNSLHRNNKGRLIKPFLSYGYPRVYLQTGQGTGKKAVIHRLMALTFLGPPPKDRPVVNHKNGNRQDNRIENLEWCSVRENHMHSLNVLGNQYGERHGSTKLKKSEVIEIHNLRMAGIGPTELAKRFNISRPQIKAILSGRLRWRELEGYPRNYPKL